MTFRSRGPSEFLNFFLPAIRLEQVTKMHFCTKFALSEFDVNQIFRAVLFHVTVENTEIFYVSYHLIKFEKRYLET